VTKKGKELKKSIQNFLSPENEILIFNFQFSFLWGRRRCKTIQFLGNGKR
jgi:hypothetical protein